MPQAQAEPPMAQTEKRPQMTRMAQTSEQSKVARSLVRRIGRSGLELLRRDRALANELIEYL
jgi:hypothetical protein